MNNIHEPRLLGLTIKAVVVHTITYFVMGILAYTFLNYNEAFSNGTLACLMRPTTDRWVMAGVLFQPIRGVIFASVFYLLREPLFGKKNGWLIMWWTLVGLGILSTFGPAPASIEAVIYTKLPLPSISSYIEIVPQALLLSAVLFYWVNHPDKRWLSWLFGGLFIVIMLLPVLGLLATR